MEEFTENIIYIYIQEIRIIEPYITLYNIASVSILSAKYYIIYFMDPSRKVYITLLQ